MMSCYDIKHDAKVFVRVKCTTQLSAYNKECLDCLRLTAMLQGIIMFSFTE